MACRSDSGTECWTYPEDIYDDVMNLNLRYAFLTCQAVAKSMADRSIPGAIVNVSSVSALPTSPGHGPYGAAKAALIAMSKTMAMEWSGMGIRVNIVGAGLDVDSKSRRTAVQRG